MGAHHLSVLGMQVQVGHDEKHQGDVLKTVDIPLRHYLEKWIIEVMEKGLNFLLRLQVCCKFNLQCTEWILSKFVTAPLE